MIARYMLYTNTYMLYERYTLADRLKSLYVVVAQNANFFFPSTSLLLQKITPYIFSLSTFTAYRTRKCIVNGVLIIRVFSAGCIENSTTNFHIITKTCYLYGSPPPAYTIVIPFSRSRSRRRMKAMRGKISKNLDKAIAIFPSKRFHFLFLSRKVRY